MCRTRCAPSSMTSPSASGTGGRSARSFSDTMQPRAPWATSACGAAAEQFVHRAALVRFDVAEGDPAQSVERGDRGDGLGDEREGRPEAGVEEQGLLVVDQVLVEGEAGRADVGDEGREPVDAFGDLVDLRVHVMLLRGSGGRGGRGGRDQRGRGWRRIPVPGPRSARIRQNSTASMSTCSPPAPARNWPPAGPPRVERERLTMRARPLGDDVGHDPAVVVGIDVDRLGRGPSQVDAVHPHVTGEADVEEVGERLPADRSREVEQGKPGDGTREPGAGAQRPGSSGVPLGDQLLGAECRLAREPGARSSRPTRTGRRSRRPVGDP